MSEHTESGAKKTHDFLRTKPIGWEFTVNDLLVGMDNQVSHNIVSGWLWYARKKEMIELVGKVPNKGTKPMYLYRLLDHEGVGHLPASGGSKKGRQNKATKLSPLPDLPLLDHRDTFEVPKGHEAVRDEAGRATGDVVKPVRRLSERLFDLVVEVGVLEELSLELVSTEALVQELARRFKKE